MKYIWRIAAVLLAIASYTIWLAAPVLAISSTPDTLQINSVNVYQNCLQNGDMLFWVDYTIKYNSGIPTEPASTTYIVRMIDSTTGTDIRDDLPYPYFDNGYTDGLAAVYFTQSDVATFGLTWGKSSPYYFVISGNPTASWAGGGTIPQSTAFQSQNFNWALNDTTIGINQTIITSDLLAEAVSIQNRWNDLALYQLAIPTVSGGYVLSTQGQQYFTAILPNLSMLVPNGLLTPANSALLLVTSTPVATPYSKTIGNDFMGSSLDLTNSASALHIGGMWLGILLTLGITFFVVVHGTKEVNSYKPFIILTLPLIYIFTRIGWFPMALTIGLTLFAGFTIWYCIFYEKSIS